MQTALDATRAQAVRLGERGAGDAGSSRTRLFALGLCLVLGACLRLRGLGGQIPLDDEWHGLDFALSHDLWFLLNHFSRAGANSVPFNLYLRAALNSFGWTEVSIALPSLVSGLLLLWVFPSWLWRRFGAVAATVAAAGLAISPFLVCYSQVARAYSVLLLLEGLALVALCEWLRCARRRHAVELAVFGALAIWVHASALPAMVAALAAAAGHRWVQSRRADSPLRPSTRQVIVAGLATVGLAGALWLPALRTPMPEVFHPSGHFSMRTFTGAFALVSGTSSVPLQILYLAVVLAGVGLAARVARQELLILGAAIAGSLLAVLAAQPNLSGVPGVLVRYLLAGFLLASLAVGVLVEGAVRAVATATRKGLLLAAASGLLAALFALGPLPRLWRATNSFTKHPAFAFDYASHDPERARPDPLASTAELRLRRSDLQPFYAELGRAPGKAPVIEYPFLLGEDANLLYFAQQLHRRPVLAGYYRSGALDGDVFGVAVAAHAPANRRPPSPGYILNGFMVDHVLGRTEQDPRIRFRTVVDIADPVAVAASRAEYLILHWNLLREFFHIGPEWERSGFVGRIREKLVGSYGAPVVDNGVICVFRVAGGW